MRSFLLVMLAASVAACGNDSTNPDPDPEPLTGNARLRVVHTVPGIPAVDVLIGGQVAIANLPFGTVSAVVAVPEGTQDIAFRAAGASGTAKTSSLALAAGDTTTVLTVDSSSILNPWVLSDSGATVPGGRSKLRVVHFAEGVPNLLAWRTQPDFGSFITIQFPFPYQNATPYVESDPGSWQVLVSTAAYAGGVPAQNDTLAMSDPIAIPAGESRTVLIMDGVSGGVALVVITP